MGHFHTSATVLLAVALLQATARAQPAPAEAEAEAAPPVVFFWASASPADAAARTSLAAAVDRAARRGGAQAVDLSPPAAPAAQLGEQVGRAVAAYDAMRFPDAIYELDQAATAAAEHGGRGLTREQLVDLFLYRGLARTEAGDAPGAWSDFVRAAALDPARVLDPARFRPSAVKSFTRAVDEVKARAQVALTVAAPAGARIFIDGRPAGGERATEAVAPGDHYVWVDRPSAPPFARALTVAVATQLDVPEDAAAPPDDGDLRRRAARLGAGPALLVALRRDGGIALVELREIGPRGARARGVVRLGPSPAADARDVEAAVTRAVRQAPRGRGAAVAAAGQGEPREERWYQNRWLWLGMGAAAALLAVTPFLIDTGDDAPAGAALDTGALEP